MRRSMLGNGANCLQQRHCVREELVWHVFYLVLLAGAAIVDSQSTVTAIALSQVIRPQVNHRFNQLAHDDLLSLTMLHISKMLIGGSSMLHLTLTQSDTYTPFGKSGRIRLLNDVLVKFVRVSDTHGDERVPYAQQCAATRHQHRVPFNLCHGPAISPCSGKTISKAPAGAQMMTTLKNRATWE